MARGIHVASGDHPLVAAAVADSRLVQSARAITVALASGWLTIIIIIVGYSMDVKQRCLKPSRSNAQ